MMKKTLLTLLCALILLLAFVEAQKQPNIDYLCYGYDIYEGNPHSTARVDPGFKVEKIFDLTYKNGEKSSDGAWDVPDSVTMAKNDACALDFESSEINSMESYQKTLENEVTVKGGFADVASFKASTDYKSTEKKMTTTNEKHIYSSAVCDVYRAKASVYNPPRLHPEFIYALKSLPSSYNEQEYFDFLNNFGTHAVTEINMGARFGMMSTISEKTYEQFRSEGITVGLAASATVFGISGGIDTRTITQKEWANKYSSSMTSIQMISVGAKPVSGGDAVAWAQQAFTQPMPLRYTLIPLSGIVTSLYVRGSIDTNHMNAIGSNLQIASRDYCNKYLKPRKMVADCNAPASAVPHVYYQAHVQNIGWMNRLSDGETAGTVGRSMRMEALKIWSNVAQIRYKAHVQNIGWQDWVSDGAVAGTTGAGLRMEAVQIELVNPPPGMSVIYRVHVEQIGWNEWVSQGTMAGTTGIGRRMEAIEIKLIQR